jgi:Family of unknown function (DUF5754)
MQMCRNKRSGGPARVYLSQIGGEGGAGAGGGKKYTPNMELVERYNKLKSRSRLATYKGRQVTLYLPEPSEQAKKKLKVYVESPDGETKVVHFGHPDYEDYTIHRDEERRRNYCARSGGIKGTDNVASANYWSRMVLWNC